MELGILVPAIAAIVTVAELAIFSRLRSRIPTRTEAGYEPGETEKRGRALSVVMLASLLTPVLLYVILNVFAPEIGKITVFTGIFQG